MEYFNKNIDFNYEIIEKYETGIILKGYETKSLRLGHCIIKNSFAKIIKNEIFLFNLNIPILDKNNFIKDNSDKERKLLVRTNADTPRDAKQAATFGAEGIGLCRTEHMFFEEERIFNFRRMITAEDVETRKEALEKILPYQRGDFEELFKAMDGYSVNIRFLDPPLHEFLPHTD